MPAPVDLKTQTDAKPVSTAAFVAEEALLARRSGRRGSHLRVLLVEDERADVELVLHLLCDSGFDATADLAQTAEEFGELLRKHSYVWT
jgi:hypothetical protein